MLTRSKQMAASIAAGQTMELRHEPRQFVTSNQSSTFPSKSMAFASEDDDPPAYIGDTHPLRRDQLPRTRTREGNLLPVASVYTPPPSRGRDYNSNARKAEPPLRPNRRDDVEFGVDNRPPPSQVMLPISANHRPRRLASSGGYSGKHWLRNIKSPIGEPHAYLLVPGPTGLLTAAFPRYARLSVPLVLALY